MVAVQQEITRLLSDWDYYFTAKIYVNRGKTTVTKVFAKDAGDAEEVLQELYGNDFLGLLEPG